MLPKSINPFLLADKGSVLTGQLEIDSLTRLKEALSVPQTGAATVKLQFGIDINNRRTVDEEIELKVSMNCQRCGEIMQQQLKVISHLIIVETDEQAARLPKEYDVLVSQGEKINTADLVEDELLLNIPQFPKHKPEECKIELPEFISFNDKKLE